MVTVAGTSPSGVSLRHDGELRTCSPSAMNTVRDAPRPHGPGGDDLAILHDRSRESGQIVACQVWLQNGIEGRAATRALGVPGARQDGRTEQPERSQHGSSPHGSPRILASVDHSMIGLRPKRNGLRRSRTGLDSLSLWTPKIDAMRPEAGTNFQPLTS